MATCTDCGVERPSLHIHHIIPRSQGGSNDPDNLVPLCSNCHEDRHGGSLGGSLRGLHSQTEEARAKRSATMKEHWADPEFRARGEAALRSPEKRAKGSAAQGRLWADPEYRAVQGPKSAVSLMSQESRAKAQEGRQRWLSVPENREKEHKRLVAMSQVAAIQRKKSATNRRLGIQPPEQTPEFRAANMAHAREFLDTPEAKANWRASMERVAADPEVQARKAATMRAKFADPEYAARQNAAMGRGGESCKRGHPFDEVNTYIDGRGRRVCRTCKAEATRASVARRNPDRKVRGPYATRRF